MVPAAAMRADGPYRTRAREPRPPDVVTVGEGRPVRKSSHCSLFGQNEAPDHGGTIGGFAREAVPVGPAH
ncbi:hypothetical protein GCM10009802_22660 [Streptomyces synnematoformans]|uniref:Uncharacterized protein n=1 Tax=Streptomyces synnematoformans TaxID=415721 RepID=A0ABN2Y248_9ACTN